MARRTKNKKDYNNLYLATILVGMRDSWLGVEGNNVESLESAILGETASEVPNWSDKPGYSLGVQLGEQFTVLARSGKVFPNEEGALGRLILVEEATAMDYVLEAGEYAHNAGDSMLSELMALF